MGGRGLLLLVVMGVMVTGMAGTELQCDKECTCLEEKKQEHDYKVVCNASTLLEATVTEQLLAGMSDFTDATSPRTLVTVEGGPSLTLNITLGFFLRWREFPTCFLNVVGAGNVIFPAVVPRFEPNTTLPQFSAAVSLKEVGVSEVPVNVFSGKQIAAFHLTNSTMGRLPAGLLQGATSLYQLYILNSTVGVMEGPLGEPALTTETWMPTKRPVLLADSTVGLLSGGALRLKVKQGHEIMLQRLSLGRVDSGAVEVEGGKVVMEQCSVARVEAGAMLLGRNTHLTLRDNWLALQPDALTHLQCGQDEHSIINNHFYVMQNATAIPVSLITQQGRGEGEDEIDERKRLADILSTVIHPSCVSYNLPPLPSEPPPPVPQASTPAPQPFVTQSQLALIGGIGIAVGVTVTCILLLSFQRCRRRRRNHHVKPPTMIMSQLSDEPIYSEPSNPLDLPPFPTTLCRPDECSPKGTTPDTCRRNEDRGICGGETKTVENEYVVMNTR